MTRFPTACLALPVALAATLAGVTAAEARIEKRQAIVAQGEQTMIFVHANPGADCTGLPLPDIALIRSPRHGEIAIQDTTQTVSGTGTACDGQTVPAIGVVFIPAAGYVGEDHFRYKEMKPDGTPAMDAVVDITVQ